MLPIAALSRSASRLLPSARLHHARGSRSFTIYSPALTVREYARPFLHESIAPPARARIVRATCLCTCHPRGLHTCGRVVTRVVFQRAARLDSDPFRRVRPPALPARHICLFLEVEVYDHPSSLGAEGPLDRLPLFWCRSVVLVILWYYLICFSAACLPRLPD